ncbi:MAG: RNA 2'-phosphotransferase [Chloroflexota bacterium]
MSIKRISKFLSLVLRHKPEQIGLRLDVAGWADVPELIRLARQAGVDLNEELLVEVVQNNDKQRFALSPDGQRIRANQGHSIDVTLGLKSIEPPETLYHGTATRFLEAILQEGLKPGNRQHVHLSSDVETAIKVGRRHGKPTVLVVQAGPMARAGYLFYRSDNGVWLTDYVSPQYLEQEGA